MRVARVWPDNLFKSGLRTSAVTQSEETMEMTKQQAEERYAQLYNEAGHLFLEGKLQASYDKGVEADQFWAEYRRGQR